MKVAIIGIIIANKIYGRNVIMLKMLRADFYKIFKSKVLLVLLIVVFCCVIANPLYLMDEYIITNNSVYRNLESSSMLRGYMWIFVVPFVAKDLSSGFLKNIFPSYSNADKAYYILSKLFYIFALCLLYFILDFIVNIIFTAAANPEDWMMYNLERDDFTVGFFYFRYIAQMINAVAIGSLLMLLCVLIKREYIVFIIVLPYLFLLGPMLYEFINDTVALLAEKMHLEIDRFDIDPYTVFGGFNILSSRKSYTVIPFVLGICYTIVFTLLSYVAVRRRSY